MDRRVKLAVILGLAAFGLPASAQENGLLELGTKPPKNTIVPIGSAPAKKTIPLKLGALRTEEAKLPPAPLTRSERMALRAKRAMSRQRAVSNASRQRVAERHRQPPPKEAVYDAQEEIPVGANGDPILE